MSSKIAGLAVIPPGFKTIIGQGGKVFIQKKTRSRRRFKTSAKQRAAVRAGLRRFKIPVLTTVAVGIPLTLAVEAAGGTNKVFTMKGFKRFGNHLLGSYTGFQPLNENNLFQFSRMGRGLGPLIGLLGVRRFGIFRGINAKLTRMRIPISLS